MRAAQINDLHHRSSDTGSSSLFVRGINPTLSDAEVENLSKRYGPIQAHVAKESIGLDLDGWRLQVTDPPRSCGASLTGKPGDFWVASSRQDHTTSHPCVQPTDFEPDVHYHHGLAALEPESIYYNSQDLRSEAPSTERFMG